MKHALTSLLAIACCISEPSLAVAEAPRPNVLFIVADDLRPDLGCYGNTAVHTPNIDRLASRGLVFDRAYCQVALCNPSRASVLTGRRPDATQVLDNGAHVRSAMPDVVTLPQLFKQHGYHSQGVGKIFHPGSDDAPSWSAPHWDPQGSHDEKAVGAALVEEMKSYYGPEGRATIQKAADEAIKAGKDMATFRRRDLLGPSWEIVDAPDDELVDGQTAKRAVELLRQFKGKGRPFFLAVGFLKPHLPFVAPKRYWDLHPLEEISFTASPVPKDVPPPALHEWSELRAFTDIPQKGPVSDEQARHLVRGYRAATSYMDAQVGRVLDELERLGLREDTVIVFWGDHGWQLGEHGLWCKHTNFEIATRAPLIVSTPGMKSAGLRTRALVEFVDIYPTLAKLAALPPPSTLEGTSLVPLLRDPDRPWKTAAFSQYLRPGREKYIGRSVRTERWRYTEWIDMKGAGAGAELYDHETDAGETRNLANDPASRDALAKMAKVLHDGWQAAKGSAE